MNRWSKSPRRTPHYHPPNRLKPYVDELRKCQKISMDEEAKLYCMGILKGIDKFQREATTEFKDWAVDDPHEKFIQVFSRWIKENMHPENLENMAEFMKVNHTKRYIDVFEL